MLVQIYEVSSPEEARALGELGVDHIGVLVGDGAFPREQSVDRARLILSAVPSTSRRVALSLSADLRLIERIIAELKPDIMHLGASTDLLTPTAVQDLKRRNGAAPMMRSIPVTGDDSVAVAQSYDGIADMLLLDSHRPGDIQIGALGVTHSWDLDRRIVESVRIPVIIAGGLDPTTSPTPSHWCSLRASIQKPKPTRTTAATPRICRRSGDLSNGRSRRGSEGARELHLLADRKLH